MNYFLIVFALVLICLLQSLQRISNFLRIVLFSTSFKGPGLLEVVTHLKNGEILNWLQDLQRKYGPIFRIWFLKDLSIYITDPADIKLVLTNTEMLNKSRIYRHLEPWLGKGLITSNGEFWHTKRKLLTPAFHFKILSEFKQPIEDNCKIMLNKLEEKANGEAFDVYPYTVLLALDIICETAMGIKKHAQLQSNSDYMIAIENVCRIAHQQMFSVWKRSEFLFSFTKAYKERNRCIKYLHGETEKVIETRRKALKFSNISTIAEAETHDDIGVKKRLAFLDILLLAQMERPKLSDLDIREQVNTFMFAGHDTTSSTLNFTLYLLSQNKVEQQKAYEEAVAMKGKEKETMKYLEAVIKESLRLYPVIPVLSRTMVGDVKLRDLTIPKGTNITIPLYLLHRNAKYFPDPEKFDPNRFLIDEKTMVPYSFVPFSSGPRNCIGQKFAMLELKCLLASFLRTFELFPVEGFVPKLLPEISMKSGNGIQIRIRKRKTEVD